MAGHSKFKNIMYRKGAQDKKRSALFSKLSREITVAAKAGLPAAVQVEILEDQGHMVQMEAADRVNALIQAFLPRCER